MTEETTKKTLVNGEPVEDAEGTSDVSGEGTADVSDEQAGAESPTPPTSAGEIKDRAKGFVERLKKDGPEPVREAAKSLVDRAFDTVDVAFDKWFGKSEK